MEIKHLRSFISVARCGSFSRAAIALGIGQPALSRQIRCLETDVGSELFYRNGRGVVVTEAGRILADYAETIINASLQATSEIKSMGSRPSGEVVLGLPPAIGTELSVPVVDRFRERFPGVSLHLIEAFSGHILEWLGSARIDVGIVYNVSKTTTLDVELLMDEELYLVSSASSPKPFAGDTLSLTDIARIPLVLPSHMHGLRTLIDASLSRVSCRPQVLLEIDGLAAILRQIENGSGCTILPLVAVHRELRDGRLRAWPIAEAWVQGKLFLATSTQRPNTPVTRALARIVKAEAQALRERLKTEASSWQQAGTGNLFSGSKVESKAG